MSEIKICVAVITRNRPESLGLCLQHIYSQTRQADEVIVIDNSADYLSSEMIKSKYPNVRYFKYEGKLGCQPSMRNLSLEKCECNYIAFTDDDGYPNNRWLAEIEDTFKKYDSAAVGGRIIQGELYKPNKNDDLNCGRFNIIKGPIGNFNIEFNEEFEVEQLQGTNMAFKVSALKDIHGWDVALESGYASFEELDVCIGVRMRGGKIYFNPRAIVTHGLEPRENGLPRDYGSSVKFAYSSLFNYMHVIGKYKLIDTVFDYRFILIFIVFSKRCLFDGRDGVRLGKFNSIFGVARGMFSGYSSGKNCNAYIP